MRPRRSSTIAIIACAVALLSLLAAARGALADPSTAAMQGGPFQISSPTAGEWVIINTQSGRFERWVFTGERYTVEASSFGGDGFTLLRYVRVGRP